MRPTEVYLDRVCGEVRWKRARAGLRRELAVHLEEQKADCLAEGMTEPEAEEEAVRQMGDPVQVGRALNAVHRPASQWGLLCLTALLAVPGAVLRAGDGGVAVLLRTGVFLLLGLGLLLFGYFSDYRRLGRLAGPICGGTLLLGLLLLRSPMVDGVPRLALYAAQLFPPGYALGVHALRGRGWGGFIAAVLLALPFLALSLQIPSFSMALVFAVSAVLTLLYATARGWFRAEKRCLYVLIGGAGLALLIGFLCVLTRSSLYVTALHPELDPMGTGYQSLALRDVFHAAADWGEGAAAGRTVSGASSDHILSGILLRWGRIPTALLCAALLVLFTLLLLRCRKQKNALGGLAALSVTVLIGGRLLLSLASLCGFLLFVSDCPFLSGGFRCALDMGLVGLALSVFRQTALPEDGTAPRSAGTGSELSASDMEVTP